MVESNKTGDDPPKPIDHDILEFREEVAYLPNEKKPFTGVAKKKYENGQKLSETNYKDGRVDGLLTAWYENGNKELEQTYKDGKLNGPYISSWYANGQKEEENNWKDGKLHGKWTVWFENGKINSEAIYRDGALVSRRGWDPDGNPE